MNSTLIQPILNTYIEVEIMKDEKMIFKMGSHKVQCKY